MPPIPVISDIDRCALVWNYTTLTAANVMHFRNSAGNVAALVSALQANMTATMWGGVNSASSIVQSEITPLDGTSSRIVTPWAANAKWTGQQATEAIIQEAIVVKLQTGLRGRSRRGRIYIPFAAEGVQSLGILDPTVVAGMQTAWENFRVAMNSAGFPLGVASYKLELWATCTAVQVERAFGTQRRRQNRVRKAAGL
jgi:hypothetical protein